MQPLLKLARVAGRAIRRFTGPLISSRRKKRAAKRQLLDAMTVRRR